MSRGTLNKVILIGHLGEEPEIRYTTSGNATANLRIATNESWKGKDGNKQERTEWHTVVVWDKLAELAAEYFHKGMLLYVEGRLQTRSYEKDGVKKYFTEVIARDMQMLSGKGQSAHYEEAPIAEQQQPSPQDDNSGIPF